MRKVLIVGGGITGLAAAYFLKDEIGPENITLIEETAHLGGKISTTTIGGTPTETGPDSFVAGVSAMEQLIRGLNLEGELITSNTDKTFIYLRGKLRALPKGLTMAVPATNLYSFISSGILSTTGLMRCAMDLILPRERIEGDISVGRFFERRFGSELKGSIVDPLIGGIMACDLDQLSMESALPSLFRIAKEQRSMILALRNLRRPAGQGLLTFKGGLKTLVDKISPSIKGVNVIYNQRVNITREGGRWKARAGGLGLDVDYVVLAVPAFRAAEFLAKEDEGLAGELRSIRYASVAVVTMAYDKGVFNAELQGGGFLVPSSEGGAVNACSYLSRKWRYSQSDKYEIVRCFIGRPDEEGWKLRSDGELLKLASDELGRILWLKEGPREHLVTRWNMALPQYRVGHRALVDRIESNGPPGMFFAGAAYHGVGISSCVNDAKKLVSRMGKAASQ